MKNIIFVTHAEKGPSGGAKYIYKFSQIINEIENFSSEVLHIKKKKYSTVTQLESKISGVLKNNVSNEDIFDNLMPPGSVTGTPKSRAIQIIKEIEDHERGPYCGAIGIFEPSGDFCFSVGIRVAIIEKNKSRFYTGAGIVWDSKLS